MYLCDVFVILEQTAAKFLVFVTETECVCRAAANGSLSAFYANLNVEMATYESLMSLAHF